MVKDLPAMQETQVRSVGWEDALEKEMVTHSSARHTQHGGGGLGWVPTAAASCIWSHRLLSCLESWLSGTAFSLVEPIFFLTSAGKAPEHCESADSSPT